MNIEFVKAVVSIALLIFCYICVCVLYGFKDDTKMFIESTKDIIGLFRQVIFPLCVLYIIIIFIIHLISYVINNNL